MGFIDIAKKRSSVRSYQAKKVEQEKLDAILEAAHVAPSAANRQPVRLIVVQSDEAQERLGKGARFYNAPLVIIVCVDRNEAWTRSSDGMQSTDIDASIVTDHMMLAATELGLGSVWICAFDPQVVREEFDLPSNLVPVNLLAIGYAEGETKSPDRHESERKPLADIVSFDVL